MAAAELEDDGFIWITADPREYEAIKLVPGAKWFGKRAQFRFRQSWAACLQLRSMFGDRLDVGPRLTEWALETRTRKDQLRYLASLMELPSPEWQFIADSPLYPPQVIGTEFVLLAGGAILGDDMGGGKTPQLCIAMKELLDANPDRRVLVVGGKSSIELVWVPHIREWMGEEPAVAIGNIKQRRAAIESDARVVCITYDTLHYHSRLAPYGNTRYKRCDDCLRAGDPKPADPIPEHRCESHVKELNDVDWLAVVADEAHKIKDPKSKRARALKAVLWPSSFRWLATGTPMANHEADFWSLLNACAPDEWPSRTEYIDRYCLQGWSPWGGMNIIGLNPATADEFHELVASRMIRRPRAVLMPWLPEAQPPQTRYVDLPTKMRKTYNQMRDELIAEIDNGLVLAPNPLTNTYRLRQLACAMLEVQENGAYKMVEPSPKLDELEDIVEEVGPTEPIVVFSESKQLIRLAEERLTKAGITWSSFHGDKTDIENNSDYERWQRGETQVIMLTLAKGSESLTLVRAYITVYLMDSYSSIMMDQSARRTDRGGQTRSPLHIHIRARDTIETRVAESVEDKGVRFEALVRDRDKLKELL